MAFAEAFAERRKDVRQLMAGIDIQCMALLPGANLRYFTGLAMHLSERPTVAFLPLDGALSLVIPDLEVAGARPHLPADARVYAYRDEQGHEHAFFQVVQALELEDKAIGVEFLAMRLLEMHRIRQAAPGCRLVATEPWLPALRMVKDPAELANIRQAVEIAERAMVRLHDAAGIRVGRTELEVAADLQIALLREGAQGEAFRPIVVAGPNSASPHAGPSDRPLAPGDLVIIDWGAVVDGYRSDITRTFALGDPSPEQVRIHDAVLAANQAGRLAVRPGMPAQEVDRQARRAIASAGYGEFFIHRTGHGLGLETHEPPYLVEGNLEALAEGMTFTVEPGVYVPGLGGVRIEDDVVVTESGSETLTTLPRDLMVL